MPAVSTKTQSFCLPNELSGLSLMSTAVMLAGVDGHIVWANPAAEALIGCSIKMLGTMHLKQFFPDVVTMLAGANKYHNEQPSSAIAVTELIRSPLPSLCVQLAVTELTALQNKAISLMVEVTEVESTLKLNREETQADVGEASRQLLRNLAHEIKNPLGGIRGAAQLLESELDEAEQREFTTVIIEEADRLQRLVDRLLAPYRMKREESDVNIHEVLEYVRSLMLMEFPEGLVIERDYDISVPALKGDRTQLIQVFLNIVRNAAEVLEEKRRSDTAKIIVRTRVARGVTIGSDRVKLALCVNIIDNGPGIAPDIQDRIFYPLVTGRAQGSGLGLSLAQTFIRQHGGLIEVQSSPGMTDFRVLLPFQMPQGNK